MASHGAAKERIQKVGKFHHLEIHPAANGGAVIHHVHEHNDGLGGFRPHGEPHVFGKDSGAELAEHIGQRIGISMPGKSAIKKVEPEESDEE